MAEVLEMVTQTLQRTIAATLLALVFGQGCSSAPPGPSFPVYPDTGPPAYDVYIAPVDSGPPADMFPVPDAQTAIDATPADATPDAAGACEEPKDLSCPSACPADHRCVKAMGPRCAKTVTLVGPADKKVFAEIAKAYVDCWSKDPADDTLCGTFDSCALEGLVSEQLVKTWVCEQAQVLDFPSGAVLEQARSLCACGTLEFIDRPDWKVGIEPGKRGQICIWYDVKSLIWDDRINVDYCENFGL